MTDGVLAQSGALTAVGRAGHLNVAFARDGRTTVLSHAHCTSPWHWFPPTYRDETGCAYAFLVNPSGGLVGGDRLSVEMAIGPRAHAVVATPSATRVYRSHGEPAVQDIHLSVGPGGILEWLPEVVIPFAGSRYEQRIRVNLAPGATIVLWDAIVSGRVARGERWAFASLENEIRVVTACGDSLLERYTLTPGSTPDGVGLARDWDYVASLYLIGDAFNAEVWKRLEDGLAAILDERPGLVLGGVSMTAAPGLALKVLARSAPDLSAILEAMWGTVRAHLWGLPAPALRRY